MRTFVVILAFCLVGVFAEDPINDVNKDFITACLIEHGFDPEQYPNGLKNEKIPEKEEKNRNCYYACMMKKMNFMNTDGTLNESNIFIKFSVNVDKLGKALDTCKSQNKNDSCKLASCLMANRDA